MCKIFNFIHFLRNELIHNLFDHIEPSENKLLLWEIRLKKKITRLTSYVCQDFQKILPCSLVKKVEDLCSSKIFLQICWVKDEKEPLVQKNHILKSFLCCDGNISRTLLIFHIVTMVFFVLVLWPKNSCSISIDNNRLAYGKCFFFTVL